MKKLSQRKIKWIERTVSNDRSYKRVLYNRFFTFAFAVLAQIIAFLIGTYLLVYHSKLGMTLQTIIFILELVFVLYIINKNERPSMRMGWIIFILVVPIFGVPMYLINGRGVPTRRMNKKIQRAKAENEREKLAVVGIEPKCKATVRNEAVCEYLSVNHGYPVYHDGEVKYYKNGEDAFPDMLEALRSAKKYILLEYFIIAHGKMWNEILKILVEKAMLGVKVRIIYDDFGCMVTLPPTYERYLEGLHENIKCMNFNPIIPVFAMHMNNRDHRKMLVVDGKVVFTGGLNLADEYINEKRRFGYWKDNCVRVKGTGVRPFITMFFYMWNAFRKDKESLKDYLEGVESLEEKQNLIIQPYDDSPLDARSVGEAVYLDIINRAAKYVYIFTPYLILDDSLRLALSSAALRGVDVRIVTPAVPDKKMVFRLTRANYAPLLRAGVKIYEYTPGFIHAKSMVCDDECAVVGTINLDYRSLYHHFENAVSFSGCDAVLDVKRDSEETFAISKPCSLEYPKRRFVGRMIDSVLRVFESLV